MLPVHVGEKKRGLGRRRSCQLFTYSLYYIREARESVNECILMNYARWTYFNYYFFLFLESREKVQRSRPSPNWFIFIATKPSHFSFLFSKSDISNTKLLLMVGFFSFSSFPFPCYCARWCSMCTAYNMYRSDHLYIYHYYEDCNKFILPLYSLFYFPRRIIMVLFLFFSFFECARESGLLFSSKVLRLTHYVDIYTFFFLSFPSNRCHVIYSNSTLISEFIVFRLFANWLILPPQKVVKNYS